MWHNFQVGKKPKNDCMSNLEKTEIGVDLPLIVTNSFVRNF